jgi:glycosyltransferase involved in cell wall biosynthesis
LRVLFLPKNIDGSGWYRCLFPASYLTERGHFAQSPPMSFRRPDGTPASVFPDGQLPEGWLQCHYGDWPDADVYVFQMANDTNVPDLIKQIQGLGKKVVVEVDDDLLHVPAYNPFNDDPTVFHKCVEIADAVTVSTESLRRSYEKLNPAVTVLRNRLHWPMWTEIPPVYERQEWRRLRVGWMGILEYHKADLDVLRPWLREWLLLHPDVEFVSCGGADVHEYLNIPEPQRVTTDRTDFRHLELAYITSVMDVGLVPLAENRFNEGKSYLKGLEYSACGIVPIATPTEQYKELIEHGVNGFLCRYSGQWLKALDSLVDDDYRYGIAKAAFENAGFNTYAKNIGEWETLYQRLADLVEARKTLWTPAAA